MWEGYSPFERTTFRYPPLIALIMIPNLWFQEFGKVFLSIFVRQSPICRSSFPLRTLGWSTNAMKYLNTNVEIGDALTLNQFLISKIGHS
jgi:hypothetical protein